MRNMTRRVAYLRQYGPSVQNIHEIRSNETWNTISLTNVCKHYGKNAS